MKLMKRGVALALIAAWGLVSLPAQAYEKDKTYKITILHTGNTPRCESPPDCLRFVV